MNTPKPQMPLIQLLQTSKELIDLVRLNNLAQARQKAELIKKATIHNVSLHGIKK